jgi:hypothetical protein
MHDIGWNGVRWVNGAYIGSKVVEMFFGLLGGGA